MSTLIKKNLPMIDFSCIKSDNSTYLLKITVSENEKGIIFKLTAVLFNYNWNIEEAIAETVDGTLVKEVFLIKHLEESKLNAEDLRKIKSDLALLMTNEITVSEYLNNSGRKIRVRPEAFHCIVNVFNPQAIDFSVLDIQTVDSPGLLFEISKILYEENIDIISFTAKSEGKNIRDSFLLCTPDRIRLSESQCDELRNKILATLTSIR